MNFEVLFFVFCGIVFLSGLWIAYTNNIIYAVLGFLVLLLGVAGVYVWASADLVAVAQILLYVGGTLVLMLFGIMLTKRLTKDFILEETPTFKQKNIFLGTFSAVLLFYLLAKSIFATDWKVEQNTIFVPKNNAEIIGYQLLTSYLLAFELTAVLLLAALIGAATIASKKKTSIK